MARPVVVLSAASALSAVAGALRDGDIAVAPAALDAVHAFMTDGAGSPLYGDDPLAARLAAEALRARIVAGAGAPRATRRRRDLRLLNLLSPPPSGRRPPAPPASTMGA